MAYEIKRSRLALKKFKKGKGDSAYRKKLINESIDYATEALRKSMPKYIKTRDGFLIKVDDMLA